jgi:hypothetical protein
MNPKYTSPVGFATMSGSFHSIWIRCSSQSISSVS